ncbi:hypothetical protein ACFLU5_14230 [Bacteroidota bacterium]
MKKLLFILLSLVLFTGFFNACTEEDVNPSGEGGTETENNDQWNEEG